MIYLFPNFNFQHQCMEIQWKSYFAILVIFFAHHVGLTETFRLSLWNFHKRLMCNLKIWSLTLLLFAWFFFSWQNLVRCNRVQALEDLTCLQSVSQISLNPKTHYRPVTVALKCQTRATNQVKATLEIVHHQITEEGQWLNCQENPAQMKLPVMKAVRFFLSFWSISFYF